MQCFINFSTNPRFLSNRMDREVPKLSSNAVKLGQHLSSQVGSLQPGLLSLVKPTGINVPVISPSPTMTWL